MIQAIPFAALIVIVLASLWRGLAVERSTGDNAWAFGSAKGKQRLAGSVYAVSIIVMAIASILAASGPASAYSFLGGLLASAGGVVVIVAQVQMGRAWRVGVRSGDAPLFVRHGLFRYSRNPIFVGMMLVGLGIALGAGNWWAWIALLTFVLACHAQVRIEEAHLRENFGADYVSFCKYIPRWIGVPR